MIQIRKIIQPTYNISQQEIRHSNTRMVLNMIRDMAPISRVDLARNCSLSVSTVSNLVDGLIRDEWVVEKESVAISARGRHAVMLEVNEQRGFVATVELLSRGYICTIYDIKLHKICGQRIKDTIYNAEHIARTITGMLVANKISIEKLLSIHLIFPGIVDQVSGDLISSAAFPDIANLDRHVVIRLREMFPQALVLVSTNGTIIALEEFVINKTSPTLPLLSLNIDEAIFGGVVMSNPDSNMNFCFPVEIGHSIIDYNGEECYCGNRGCLETLCSTPKLFKMLNERAGMKLEYSDLFGSDCNVDAMKTVAKELENKNEEVIKVLKDYTQVLCKGLISNINLLGIQSVRIGGDIAFLGETYLEMIKTTFNELCSPLINKGRIKFELFLSDYEQIRLAATLMCLDIVFNK